VSEVLQTLLGGLELLERIVAETLGPLVSGLFAVLLDLELLIFSEYSSSIEEVRSVP
jgi:hypothetical protein